MDGLPEAAMDYPDDEDDDTDMDWNKEEFEDELMKGVYSHLHGEEFPNFKAGAVKLMSMLSNLEASSSTISTRDVSRNHIKVTTDAARAVAAASERTFLLQDAAPVLSGKRVRKEPARFEAGPTAVNGPRKLCRAPQAAAAPQAPPPPRTRQLALIIYCGLLAARKQRRPTSLRFQNWPMRQLLTCLGRCAGWSQCVRMQDLSNVFVAKWLQRLSHRYALGFTKEPPEGG